MDQLQRSLEIPAPRLAGWLERFHQRHQVVSTTYEGTRAVFAGADGISALCIAPLGLHKVDKGVEGFAPEPLLKHVMQPRRVGVLLVRLGGYAAGVFDEQDRLLASKVGSRLVHGRQRNGGSSQARYARRRDNEVKALIKEATEIAVRVLSPYEGALDCVVVGGDKDAVRKVLADPRLAFVAMLRTEPFLLVPDPKRVILDKAPELYRMTRIQLVAEQIG